MTHQSILSELDKLGEALKAIGERELSLHLFDSADRPFCIGITAGTGPISNCFGYGRTPSEALKEALGKKAAKAEEMAVRARIATGIEERVRAELAAVDRREAA